jgi:hypothetical protein
VSKSWFCRNLEPRLQIVVMKRETMWSARQRSDDSAWIRSGPTGAAATRWFFSRQFPSLLHPTATPGVILLYGKFSVSPDLYRRNLAPATFLAFHYCCDTEYTIELERQYSCLSVFWPSNQVTHQHRIATGPERCSACYPAMPSRLTGMPSRLTGMNLGA